MGSKEERTGVTPTKPAAATQEIPTTASYPDWPTPVPAYYGAGAASPLFFPPTVSSPTPHPCMWGSSQHLVLPYGAPIPYPPIYPHGGLYAHPSTAVAPGSTLIPTQKGNPSDANAHCFTKSSGIVSGKSGDSGNEASGYVNDAASLGGESGSEGSTNSSDENAKQKESLENRKRSFKQMIAEGANAQQNNAAQYSGAASDSTLATRGPTNHLVSMPGKPVVAMPATNPNNGTNPCNSSPTGDVSMNGRVNIAAASPALFLPEHAWFNNERELKRQKRKQSNRESARRSRLRKQADCEDFAAKVETLSNENQTLRSELQQLAEECEKLTSENASLMEQMTQFCGQDKMSKVEDTAISPLENGEVNGLLEGKAARKSDEHSNFLSSNGKLEAGSK